MKYRIIKNTGSKEYFPQFFALEGWAFFNGIDTLVRGFYCLQDAINFLPKSKLKKNLVVWESE